MDYKEQKIIDKLVTARIALLLKHPFFGNLATRLKLVNADDWCPTAGTDGRHFFYNTKFIDSLTPKEAEFLFGHEVLHNVFEHMLVRIGDRDPQLWNIAADYAVNQILKDSNIGEMPKGKKGENKGFQDDKYKDWASERIYDDLYKQAKKNGKKMLNDGDAQWTLVSSAVGYLLLGRFLAQRYPQPTIDECPTSIWWMSLITQLVIFPTSFALFGANAFRSVS